MLMINFVSQIDRQENKYLVSRQPPLLQEELYVHEEVLYVL